MAKKLRVSKRERPETEVEEVRALSPIERRKKLMITGAVYVLVFAFCLTSGIVCTNLNQDIPVDDPGSPTTPTDQVQLDIDHWQRELATNPKDVAALANLGHFYRQRALPLLLDESKKPEADEWLGRSEENLKKALELDPRYGFAIQELATTLRLEEKNDEAREILQQAIVQAQEPVVAGEGEDEETLKAARQRTEVEARMLLADLEFGTGNSDQAQEQLTTVLELEPGNLDAYTGRARLFQLQNQPDQARADLEKALDIAQKMNDRRAGMLIQALYEMDNPMPEMTTAPAGTPTPEASPVVEEPPVTELTPEASPVVEEAPVTESTP